MKPKNDSGSNFYVCSTLYYWKPKCYQSCVKTPTAAYQSVAGHVCAVLCVFLLTRQLEKSFLNLVELNQFWFEITVSIDLLVVTKPNSCFCCVVCISADWTVMGCLQSHSCKKYASLVCLLIFNGQPGIVYALSL